MIHSAYQNDPYPAAASHTQLHCALAAVLRV